ncbi:AsnC family transcriptional regulator [Halobacterium hubeiense]|uniref:AsnC family transcriptional regulator n=1 Tax=Halobacterium hubeiense TaxID=1407499 RepID=UPI003C77281B
MADLDETDRRILELLAADARRPYSDIADEVGLSAPAVSDRVANLRDSGVIERFTVDIDRSRLREGANVLVELSVPPGEVDAVREAVGSADAVEHVFVTASGAVVCSVRLPVADVRAWVTETVGAERLREYDVRPLASAEWRPSVGEDVAMACAECGNTVTSEGETARIDGDRYHFCCPSCRERFAERYDRHDAEA